MIIPVLHRILIKPDKLEETDKTYVRARASGIIIPEHEDNKRAQASVDKGIVVSFGPTVFQDFKTDCPVSVGDRVAFARFAGKIVVDPYTDEEFVAINDEDLVCIFKQE